MNNINNINNLSNVYNDIHTNTNKPQVIDQTVRFDQEIYDIISTINPVYRNSMINMALKQFFDTDIFKYYFSKNEGDKEILNPNISNIPNIDSAQQIHHGQPVQVVQATQATQATQTASTPAPAIASWDNF